MSVEKDRARAKIFDMRISEQECVSTYREQLKINAPEMVRAGLGLDRRYSYGG